MDYLIGVALALGVSVFAALAGFDRDRAFYPTLLVVIASYYVLFGAMSGSVLAILVDAIHRFLVVNTGVPAWWPAFCLAYDITAAGVMVWLFRHRLPPTKEPWQTRT